MFLDDAPRATTDQGRPKPYPRCWPDVIFKPIAHIQDFARRARRLIGKVVKEAKIRLGNAPVIGGGHQVNRQGQLPQDLARGQGLISGNTKPEPVLVKLGQHRPHVGIQVILAEPLWLARISSAPSFLIEIEPRLEDLERLPVIQATRDNRPEHGRERMPRNGQPVSPRPVLAGLIHQDLANIERHSTDHVSHLTAAKKPSN